VLVAGTCAQIAAICEVLGDCLGLQSAVRPVKRARAGHQPLAAERHAARADGENKPVDLERLAWLATVVVSLITVLILVLQGYFGYAGVTLAVALAAMLNLF
jgi:hypothetical protein